MLFDLLFVVSNSAASVPCILDDPCSLVRKGIQEAIHLKVIIKLMINNFFENFLDEWQC